MTYPAPPPAKGKTLNGALIGALVALVALAIATVIVVLNNGDHKPGGGTAGSSSAPPSSEGSSSGGPSSASPSSASGDPTKVTVDDLGVSYTYVVDGYDTSRWDGPGTIVIGDVTLDGAVGCQACKPDAGTDMILGVTSSDFSDLAEAAKSAAQEMANGVWSGGPDTTTPTDPVEKTTDSGVKGQLVEIEATRTAGADACGTKKVHVATYAFKAKNDKTAVMVISYRIDGELPKDLSAIEKDLIAALVSIKTK